MDMSQIYKESERIFKEGEELDKKNFEKYKNYTKKQLKEEIDRINRTIHLMSDEEFKDAQSKLIVLNRLLGR